MSQRGMEEVDDTSPAGEEPSSRRGIRRASASRSAEAVFPVEPLLDAIQSEVIPRLVEARRTDGRHPAPGEVTDFVRLLLDPEPARAGTFVEALLAEEMSLRTLYLELLAPAAELLGEYWKSDRCGFVDVTLASGRMQALLREHGAAFRSEYGREEHGGGRRAVLTAAPGDQHTFGILMVSEFFRRAGWNVSGGPLWSRNEPLQIVATTNVDVFGLSVANERCVPELMALIPVIRATARNPNMKIMLGGGLFLENPDRAIELGADGTMPDAEAAVRWANSVTARVINS